MYFWWNVTISENLSNVINFDIVWPTICTSSWKNGMSCWLWNPSTSSIDLINWSSDLANYFPGFSRQWYNVFDQGWKRMGGAFIVLKGYACGSFTLKSNPLTLLNLYTINSPSRSFCKPNGQNSLPFQILQLVKVSPLSDTTLLYKTALFRWGHHRLRVVIKSRGPGIFPGY